MPETSGFLLVLKLQNYAQYFRPLLPGTRAVRLGLRPCGNHALPSTRQAGEGGRRNEGSSPSELADSLLRLQTTLAFSEDLDTQDLFPCALSHRDAIARPLLPQTSTGLKLRAASAATSVRMAEVRILVAPLIARKGRICASQNITSPHPHALPIQSILNAAAMYRGAAHVATMRPPSELPESGRCAWDALLHSHAADHPIARIPDLAVVQTPKQNLNDESSNNPISLFIDVSQRPCPDPPALPFLSMQFFIEAHVFHRLFGHRPLEVLLCLPAFLPPLPSLS